MGAIKKRPAHAIVRMDLFQDGSPMTGEGPPNNFSVVKVYWDGKAAAAEVERLNRVNGGRNCRYFAVYTRILGEPPPIDEEE